MIPEQPGPPVVKGPLVKSADAIVAPVRDQIGLRVLLILFTIAVVLAVATLLARL